MSMSSLLSELSTWNPLILFGDRTQATWAVGEIASLDWANSGSGGATYDIQTSSSTPMWYQYQPFIVSAESNMRPYWRADWEIVCSNMRVPFNLEDHTDATILMVVPTEFMLDPGVPFDPRDGLPSANIIWTESLALPGAGNNQAVHVILQNTTPSGSKRVVLQKVQRTSANVFSVETTVNGAAFDWNASTNGALRYGRPTVICLKFANNTGTSRTVTAHVNTIKNITVGTIDVSRVDGPVVGRSQPCGLPWAVYAVDDGLISDAQYDAIYEACRQTGDGTNNDHRLHYVHSDLRVYEEALRSGGGDIAYSFDAAKTGKGTLTYSFEGYPRTAADASTGLFARATLTGAPNSTTDFDIPIRNVQLRMTDNPDAESTMNITMPYSDDNAQAVLDRPDGELQLYVGYLRYDGSTSVQLIATMAQSGLQQSKGGSSQSITLQAADSLTFSNKSITVQRLSRFVNSDGSRQWSLPYDGEMVYPGDDLTSGSETMTPTSVSLYLGPGVSNVRLEVSD